MQSHDDNYETNDLALTAALIEQGHHLGHLDSTNPRRVNFIFKNSDALETCVADYWQEKLLVDPKRYFDTIRHLKSRIYAA